MLLRLTASQEFHTQEEIRLAQRVSKAAHEEVHGNHLLISKPTLNVSQELIKQEEIRLAEQEETRHAEQNSKASHNEV